MLHRYINQFLEYCWLADFSICSIQALTARLNEFDTFLKIQRIWPIKRVSYRHLVDFAANKPAPLAVKCSAWFSQIPMIA